MSLCYKTFDIYEKELRFRRDNQLVSLAISKPNYAIPLIYFPFTINGDMWVVTCVA